MLMDDAKKEVTLNDIYILCKVELNKIIETCHGINATNGENLYRIYCTSSENVGSTEGVSYAEYNMGVLADTCAKIVETLKKLYDIDNVRFRDVMPLIIKAKEYGEYIRLHMIEQDPFGKFVTEFIDQDEK